MIKKHLHLVFSITLSVTILISGICLIVSCVDVYNHQTGSFSRESVAAAFEMIQVPVYFCLTLVIAGFLLDAFSFPEKKQKPEKQYETILQNLCRKLDLTQCESELASRIRKERTTRAALSGSTAGSLIICSIVFFLYALSGKNYPDDANAAVLQAMPWFFICLGIPCCLAIITAYHQRFSMRKEIELVKKALVVGSKSKTELPSKKQAGNGIVIARYSVLAVAIVVVIVGFCLGGTADVLAKAAAICTECVGLG